MNCVCVLLVSHINTPSSVCECRQENLEIKSEFCPFAHCRWPMTKRTHRGEKVTRRTARYRIELSYCSINRGTYALQSHVIVVYMHYRIELPCYSIVRGAYALHSHAIVVCMYDIRPPESVVLETEVSPHDARAGQCVLLQPGHPHPVPAYSESLLPHVHRFYRHVCN